MASPREEYFNEYRKIEADVVWKGEKEYEPQKKEFKLCKKIRKRLGLPAETLGYWVNMGGTLFSVDYLILNQKFFAINEFNIHNTRLKTIIICSSKHKNMGFAAKVTDYSPNWKKTKYNGELEAS